MAQESQERIRQEEAQRREANLEAMVAEIRAGYPELNVENESALQREARMKALVAELKVMTAKLAA